jgi:hypothetical protein
MRVKNQSIGAAATANPNHWKVEPPRRRPLTTARGAVTTSKENG